MIAAALRPALTLTAGMAIGFLLAWGLSGHFSSKSESASVSPIAASSPLLPQVVATSTPDFADEKTTNEVNPAPALSPTSSPDGQQTGLPLGVTRDALNYNRALYQKYPGLKPPLINTDGRDIGPEAKEKMQASPTLLPNPGSGPEASVSPFALPTPRSPGSPSPAP